MTKNPQKWTNQELLRELAERIVAGELELDKPQDWIIKGQTPEQIVQHLQDKMGFYNQDGLALTNISEIYHEKTNRNPLNLNYFLVEVKSAERKNDNHV